MKRQWYFITAFLAVLSGVIIYLAKFGSHAKRLFVGVSSIKPQSGQNIASFLGGVKLDVSVLLKNFSPSAFNVEQMKIDIYTTTGNEVKLAGQPAPLDENVTVNPETNTELNLTFDGSIHGFVDLLKNQVSGINSWSDALSRLEQWLTTGELGATVKAKGFVVAEGVKIDINQTVNI